MNTNKSKTSFGVLFVVDVASEDDALFRVEESIFRPRMNANEHESQKHALGFIRVHSRSFAAKFLRLVFPEGDTGEAGDAAVVGVASRLDS